MKFHMTYDATPHPEGIEREEIPEGKGATDGLLLVSIKFREDGSESFSAISTDGRTGGPLEDRNIFNAWCVIANSLLEKGIDSRMGSVLEQALQSARRIVLGDEVVGSAEGATFFTKRMTQADIEAINERWDRVNWVDDENLSHDCWHGPYSAFMRWRRAVAHAINMPLDLMEGFYDPVDDSVLGWIAPKEGGPECGDPKGPLLFYWYVKHAKEHLPLSWDPWERSHPALCKLLDHSDCEGHLRWQDCGEIADALEQIESEVSVRLGKDALMFGGATRRWIDGLREAHRRQEDVEFY